MDHVQDSAEKPTLIQKMMKSLSGGLGRVGNALVRALSHNQTIGF
jgi:hypothetical protein